MNKRIPLSAASIVPFACRELCGDPAVSSRKMPVRISSSSFSDDLGIGDLSCYGATRVATPHIDRLAAQGQRFTNAYATSATSTPSRFGLLTGMYPWRLPNTQIAPGNSELIIDPSAIRSPTPCTMPVMSRAPLANGIWGWVPSAARISTSRSVPMPAI